MVGRLRSRIVVGAPVLMAVSASFAVAGVIGERRMAWAPGDAVFTASWVLIGAFGALVARRIPTRDLGPVLVACGATFCLAVAAHGWAVLALRLSPDLPLGSPAAWLATWMGGFAIGLLPVALLALPTGMVPRREGLVALTAGACVAAAQSLASQPLEGVDPSLRPIPNPLGVEGLDGVIAATTAAGVVTLVVVTAIAVWRLVQTVRRSASARDQLRWVVAAIVLVPMTFVVDVVLEGLGALPLARALSLVGYAAAAVLLVGAVVASTARHRLYAVESLVDRTVVFSVLTGLGVLVYGAIVGGANAVFSDRATTAASLLATAVVAVGFSSARAIVVRWTARWLFGPRVEPYEVLAALGARLEATIATGDVLPALVGALREALDVDAVAIELRDGNGFVTAAETGDADDATVVTQIVASGEVVGRLRVGRRRSGAAIDDADRRLLDDVARQAAVAIQGLRLLADLQRSRVAVVQSREEERRRLQRDLHDGLGPALAGLVLEAQAAQRMVGSSPDAATAALADVVGQLKAATTEVRRITRGLRPGVLDQLGLIGALREHAATFMVDGRLVVHLEAEPEVRLPAAVEVAAYRITCEALTNVVRHAQATSCRVVIAHADGLSIDVSDNGVGPGEVLEPGVGWRSIQERVAELGGEVQIGRAAGGGTHVSVSIPTP